MAYIAGLVIASFLFLTLHYFTELSKVQKILVSIASLGIILSAIAFNSYSNFKTKKMLNVVTKYKQGKTVQCNGLDVNTTNYTLSIGTYTFIGKKNTQNYTQMINASECK